MKVGQQEKGCLSSCCSLLGYSRQAYYQGIKEMEGAQLKYELIIQEVGRHREKQKRVGGRKLMEMMATFMAVEGIGIGRDALFDLLREHGLLVKKRRRNKPKTTFSAHWMRKYPNLVRGFIPTAACQLWVSDITYIYVGDSHCYLSLITDAYSHKIIGFYLSETLEASGPIEALKMGLRNNPLTGHSLIHHSDRGSQYCCADYVEILKKNNILISMTENGDPLENALAERVNGILKGELLEKRYTTFAVACKEVAMAINTYNHLRLHASIDMLTPVQAHSMEGELKKRWKNYYLINKEKKLSGNQENGKQI